MNFRRHLIGILLLAIALVSCSGDDGPEPTREVSNNVADVGVEDTSSDTNEEGEFEVGVNEVFQNTPDSYTTIMDGVEVPLNYGVQGSWMVVLAFRSKNLIRGTFDIRADITIDGVESGDIWLEFQETFPGGDGWDYYYNLFLAIDQNDPPARGTPATIHVLVEDSRGNVGEETYDVFIGEAIGGP